MKTIEPPAVSLHDGSKSRRQKSKTMSEIAKPTEAGKWERVRRLRYGALVKLFRHRWGSTLPDDASGREDLFELVCVVSVAQSATDKKIANTIETMAPWMKPEEAQMLAEHVQQMTIYERMPNNRELGKRMRLTNAEREALSLWPIKPVDMTDLQLAEQRKAKSRRARASKRRLRGVRTRKQYLAELASKPKPWEGSGLSRAQWYRRKRDEVVTQRRRGSDATIVVKVQPHLVSPEMVKSQKGLQGRGGLRMLRKATEGREVERQGQRGSPALWTHHVSSPDDELLIALNNWGKNAEKNNLLISPKRSERGWNDLFEFQAFSTDVPWCPLEALPRDLLLVGEIAA